MDSQYNFVPLCDAQHLLTDDTPCYCLTHVLNYFAAVYASAPLASSVAKLNTFLTLLEFKSIIPHQ
jgi:hypothetical protein